MQTLRTPDDRFPDLPEFPYPANYCDVSDGDGGTLRMAWVQDGPADADPVLMLHGEPSWSFLYRKMIPVLAAAGHRVICPTWSASVARTSRLASRTTAMHATSNGYGNWLSTRWTCSG